MGAAGSSKRTPGEETDHEASQPLAMDDDDAASGAAPAPAPIAPSADGTATVRIAKEAGAPLGVHLEDAGSSLPFVGALLGQPPPFVAVASVTPESAAFGLLRSGMAILAINGVDTTNAAQAADIIRASGGTLSVRVRTQQASGGDGGGGGRGDSSVSTSGGYGYESSVSGASSYDQAAAAANSPRGRLLIALVVCGILALGGMNAWSARSAYTATVEHERTQREAKEWQRRAKVKMAQLEHGREAQKTLAKEAGELQKKIAALSHANASASSQALAALASLRAQHANVTAQRKAWRRKQHESENMLKRARSEQSSMTSELQSARKVRERIRKPTAQSAACSPACAPEHTQSNTPNSSAPLDMLGRRPRIAHVSSLTPPHPPPSVAPSSACILPACPYSNPPSLGVRTAAHQGGHGAARGDAPRHAREPSQGASVGAGDAAAHAAAPERGHCGARSPRSREQRKRGW